MSFHPSITMGEINRAAGQSSTSCRMAKNEVMYDECYDDIMPEPRRHGHPVGSTPTRQTISIGETSPRTRSSEWCRRGVDARDRMMSR